MHASIASYSDTVGCRRIANLTFGQPLSSFDLPNTNIIFEPCADGYAWDRAEMSLSAVGRWSLVCHDELIRPMIQCMYYIGQFFGSLIFGILSDRIGRKPIFMMAIGLQIACGALMAAVPWWPPFAVLRIGVGFAHSGIFLMAVVIGAEMVGPKYRVMSGVGAKLSFALGEIILGALAYLIKDYRWLQLSISLPALIFLSYWWLVPESVRWLISKGRFKEADWILRRAAKRNGREPPPIIWYEHMERDRCKVALTSRQAMCALFATPNLRKRTLITFFLWPVVSMCFYGLAINPAFLGGDNRLGFIVGGAMEIPGLMVALFGLNFIGRKFLIAGGFLTGSVALLLTLAIPPEAAIGSMLLALVGKSTLNAAYATLYVMTPELYPTVIRNTATGACSMIARAGGVSASFMSMYVASTHPMVVTFTFAGLSMAAALAALFLPETTGEPLMETLEEAEEFGKHQPLFVSGYGNQRLVAERIVGGDCSKVMSRY